MKKETKKTTSVALDWMRALDRRDEAAVLALTSPALEYHRWSGIQHGHEAVRDLLHRQTFGVAMHLSPGRVFGRGETVVVEAHLAAHHVETGDRAGGQTAAARFVIRDGRVTAGAPHPDLAGALAAAGLTEHDRILETETDMPPSVPMTIALHGATGVQGTAIARRLLRDGHAVRGVARHPDRAHGLLPGVEPFAADLLDADALTRAYTGADAVVVQLPTEFGPVILEQGERVLEALGRAVVARVVFSTGGPTPAEPVGVPFVDARVALARALEAGPFVATVLGPVAGGYMENLLAPWSAPLLAEGVVAYPVPAQWPVPWLAMDDLADHVAAAIASGAGGRYGLAGPEALTGERTAQALVAALGRDVRWESIDPAEYGEKLRPYTGDGTADGIAGYYAGLAAGPPPPPPDPATTRLGRIDLETWARRQAWSAPATRPLPATRHAARVWARRQAWSAPATSSAVLATPSGPS